MLQTWPALPGRGRCRLNVVCSHDRILLQMQQKPAGRRLKGEGKAARSRRAEVRIVDVESVVT